MADTLALDWSNAALAADYYLPSGLGTAVPPDCATYRLDIDTLGLADGEVCELMVQFKRTEWEDDAALPAISGLVLDEDTGLYSHDWHLASHIGTYGRDDTGAPFLVLSYPSRVRLHVIRSPAWVPRRLTLSFSDRWM